MTDRNNRSTKTPQEIELLEKSKATPIWHDHPMKSYNRMRSSIPAKNLVVGGITVSILILIIVVIKIFI